MNERFGVAVGLKAMALGDQLCAQRLVIVDLAVEDHPERAVLIRNGLMAGAEVNDAETAHADGAAAFDMEAFVVRTAMANPVAHAFYEFEPGRTVAPDVACNSAHSSTLILV